jgi:hypothetical protein
LHFKTTNRIIAVSFITKQNKFKNMRIQTTNFFDGELRYIVNYETKECWANYDDFFQILLGANKALQKRKVRECFQHIEGHEEMYNIFDLNTVLMEYEAQKATVQKKPQNYRNYIAFMTVGGFYTPFFHLEIDLPKITKDISELIDGIPAEVDCEAETASLLEQNAELLLEIESLRSEFEQAKHEYEDKQSYYSHVESNATMLDAKNMALKLEMQAQKAKLEALEAQQKATKNDTLRGWLTNNKVMLYATILAIVVFLPFTVLNLKQYIAIPTANGFQEVALYALCVFIAAAWDFSILLFAVNGKKNLAVMGSCFQFIFIASKFNFFASYVELFGFDGAVFQKMIVITAIVVYSPVLIFQFAELAVTSNDKKLQN